MTKFKKIFALLFVFAISIGVFAGHNALADNSSRSAECGEGQANYKFNTGDYAEYFNPPGGPGNEPPTPPTCQNLGNVIITNVPIYNKGYQNGTFKGWALEGTTDVIRNATATGNWIYNLQDDVVFVPVFTPIQVTISFNANGGQFAGGGEMTPITQDYEKPLPAWLFDAEALSKLGTNECKTIVGWKVENTGDNIDASYEVKGDIELFAQWSTDNMCNVSINLNGGTVDGFEGPLPMKVEYNKAIEPAYLEELNIIKEGYTLSGWNPQLPQTVTDNNLELTAQWTVNKYNVDLNFAGGKTAEGAESGQLTLPYGTEITEEMLNVLGLNKEGNTLAGWDVELPYTVNAEENQTLTAQWTVNDYKIDLDFAGGKTAEGAESGQLTLPYGTEITEEMLNVLGLNKEGNTLAGWDVELPYTVNAEENQTLTAQWTVNDYKIDLDFAGGKTAEGAESGQLTLPYGTEITEEMFNNLGLIKEGYTLQGWKVNGEGEIIKSFVVPAQDVTLVAQWKAIDGGNGGETTPPTEPGTGEPTEPTEKLPETGSDAMVIAVVALLSATGLIAVRKLRA